MRIVSRVWVSFGLCLLACGDATSKRFFAETSSALLGGIAFRAQSTYVKLSANTVSMDLTVPATVQANDVMIASIFAGDYPENFLPTVTAPSGWILIRQVSDGTAGLLQIYSRVATATDANKVYSWRTNIWVGAACSLVAYSGVDSATPVDVSAAQDNPTAGATYSTPSVTTTAANDALLATFAAYSGNTPPSSTWSTPTGTTQRVNVHNGGLLALSNDDVSQAAAGPSGTLSSTANPAQTYALTALVALKPGTCTPTSCAAQGKNCGSISDGCGGTLSCGSCTAPQTCGGGGSPNVCGTAPTVDADGVVMLRPSNPSGSSFRLGTQNPSSAPGLNVGSDAFTHGVEGNVSLWTTQGHAISYGSGGTGTTVRYNIEASGGAQTCDWTTCAIANGYTGNANDLKNMELTGYVRVRSLLAPGVHTTMVWKVRGGWHSLSPDPRASCVEMGLPYGGAATRAARELTHPNYEYVTLQPLFTFNVTDGQWIGFKMLSYLRPDGTSTYNAVYVDSAPFDAAGHPVNQFRLHSEWIDQNGVSTGSYTQAALWGGWRQTLRIDGWQFYDLAILSAREILPP